MELAFFIVAREVDGIVAFPLALVEAPAALDEGGLGADVAPDRVEVGVYRVDGTVRVVGKGPDEIRVVLDEGVAAEQRAGGSCAEDVDGAILLADGIAVCRPARREGGQILAKCGSAKAPR